METNEIFKELRKSYGLTQTDLGNILNCDRFRIADIERGKTQPNIQDIKKLSQHFNVSADYLLGLSGAKSADENIQYIHKYTGLSDVSIEKLHNMVQTDDFNKAAKAPIKDGLTGESLFHCLLTGEDIKNFNSLIEDTDFYDLMLIMRNFSHSELKIALYKHKFKNAKNEIIPKMQSGISLELSEQTDHSNLSLFKLQRLFLEIVTRISENHIRDNSKWFKEEDENADD